MKSNISKLTFGLISIFLFAISSEAYWKLSWEENRVNEVNIKNLKDHYDRWNVADELKLIISKKEYKETDKIRTKDDSEKKKFEILYFTSKSNASFFRIHILEEINDTLKIEEVNEPMPEKEIVHKEYVTHILTPEMEYDPYEDSKKLEKEYNKELDEYIEKINKENKTPTRHHIENIYYEENKEKENKYKPFETKGLSTYYLENNLNSFGGF